jgi:hypothetical protein
MPAMACAVSLPPIKLSVSEAIQRLSQRKHRVKILNPMPGGSPRCTPDRAIRFVRTARAYLDSTDTLVFYGESVGKTGAGLDVVDRFSGVDAFPDRAVYPPSGEVMAKFTSNRKPLRPPVQKA